MRWLLVIRFEFFAWIISKFWYSFLNFFEFFLKFSRISFWFFSEIFFELFFEYFKLFPALLRKSPKIPNTEWKFILKNQQTREKNFRKNSQTNSETNPKNIEIPNFRALSKQFLQYVLFHKKQQIRVKASYLTHARRIWMLQCLHEVQKRETNFAIFNILSRFCEPPRHSIWKSMKTYENQYSGTMTT